MRTMKELIKSIEDIEEGISRMDKGGEERTIIPIGSESYIDHPIKIGMIPTKETVNQFKHSIREGLGLKKKQNKHDEIDWGKCKFCDVYVVERDDLLNILDESNCTICTMLWLLANAKVNRPFTLYPHIISKTIGYDSRNVRRSVAKLVEGGYLVKYNDKEYYMPRGRRDITLNELTNKIITRWICGGEAQWNRTHPYTPPTLEELELRRLKADKEPSGKTAIVAGDPIDVENDDFAPDLEIAKERTIKVDGREIPWDSSTMASLLAAGYEEAGRGWDSGREWVILSKPSGSHSVPQWEMWADAMADLYGEE